MQEQFTVGVSVNSIIMRWQKKMACQQLVGKMPPGRYDIYNKQKRDVNGSIFTSSPIIGGHLRFQVQLLFFPSKVSMSLRDA